MPSASPTSRKKNEDNRVKINHTKNNEDHLRKIIETGEKQANNYKKYI